MSNDTIITLVGNLCSEATLRFTPSGAAVVNVSVASTPRTYDKQAGEWKDGEPLFLRLNLWRELAENAADSLTKGARVIVTGRLKQRSFEEEGGSERSSRSTWTTIGPSLRYATAKVSKQNSHGEKVGSGSRRAGQAGDDPWGSAPRSGSLAGGDDAPPF